MDWGKAVCPGKSTQVPDYHVHCPGFVCKNFGMYVSNKGLTQKVFADLASNMPLDIIYINFLGPYHKTLAIIQ